jgi:hypothetical protein
MAAKVAKVNPARVDCPGRSAQPSFKSDYSLAGNSIREPLPTKE